MDPTPWVQRIGGFLRNHGEIRGKKRGRTEMRPIYGKSSVLDREPRLEFPAGTLRITPVKDIAHEMRHTPGVKIASN
jgi:hypothetical protein